MSDLAGGWLRDAQALLGLVRPCVVAMASSLQILKPGPVWTL